MPVATPVAAAIAIRHGRVLVTHRAPGQKMEGLWEFPGGKLDPGETAQDCIVRELAEELGVGSEAGEVIARNFHTYPGGVIELLGIRVHLLSETFVLSVHDEARWVDADGLLGLALAPADIPIAHAVCALLTPNTTDAE
jgi:8-oxo-dGTP diphosphatase